MQRTGGPAPPQPLPRFNLPVGAQAMNAPAHGKQASNADKPRAECTSDRGASAAGVTTVLALYRREETRNILVMCGSQRIYGPSRSKAVSGADEPTATPEGTSRCRAPRSRSTPSERAPRCTGFAAYNRRGL
jgi:hypothetical protein